MATTVPSQQICHHRPSEGATLRRIVSISLGSSRRNYAITTTLSGLSAQPIEIVRIGTDGNRERAANLLPSYDSNADAISLGGGRVPPPPGASPGTNPSAQTDPFADLASNARTTPVFDGQTLKATLERWSAKRAADMIPDLFRQRRILVLQGLDRYPLAQVLETYQPSLRFADPLLQTGVPFAPIPRSLRQLDRYAATVQTALSLPGSNLWQNRGTPTPDETGPEPAPLHPLTLSRIQKLFAWADVIVGDMETILRLAPERLPGRTIVTDDPSAEEIDNLADREVTTLVTMSPPLSQTQPFVATEVLEALFALIQQADTTQPPQLDEGAVLRLIARHEWEPTIQNLISKRKKPGFAFVVHPLSTRHIFLHPSFRFARYIPPRLLEWAAAYMPPLYLSRIRGIRSTATGEEIEGLLFSLTSTPREMLRRPPEFTYRKLIQVARRAERRGARIMGLGAFTSVVGDAGITVASRCTIGITSGNSLTVAATLEAAKRAVLMMGGRIDQGRAVIVGATGSIGAVCSRLLALAIGDVVLVAPRPERLLALQLQIERETPGTHVIAATNADAYISEADLVVTTTSSLRGNVFNIEKLKPGAVVCDVARPPNVLEEEVACRPDILVIESGEICLPGNPDFGFNIDLPQGTAYACLAETALLTMEGRFADYTLGRDIEIERVKEMYRLMNKHGLELAALRSFGSYITEADIAEKRRLAESLRQRSTPAPDTRPQNQASVSNQAMIS